MEGLEPRAMMATFTVVNVNDAGAGSFRDAVTQANATVGADTIAFAIPGTGAKTISLLAALPAITDSVTIDGTTQGVAAGPLIEIDGTGAGNAASGLRLTGGASTLRGLAINNFKLNGVLLASDGNKVEGSFIGLNPNGSTAAPNLLDGIQITGSNNVIGGTTAAAANVISGNGRNGVSITGATATGNKVEGNTIGIDLFKATKVPNVNAGVRIGSGAKLNTIGGTTAGQRNFISGNTGFGVLIENAGSDSNSVKNNLIGPGSSTSTSLGNGVGLAIRSGAKLNTIGGSEINGANTISSNVTSGVQLRGAGTSDNQLIANRVGVSDSGLIKLANGEDGVLIDTAATNNTIGGATTAQGNIISGNNKSGVAISGVGTNNNRLFSNVIGLNSLGIGALANLQAGVTVRSGAANNEIGNSASGNTISGNQVAGVRLQGVSGNKVAGNAIGLTVARTAAVANSLDGVLIEQASTANIIGGPSVFDGNLISGNTRAGIRISGIGTNSNIVMSNKVGTAADSNVAIANAIGVWITSGAKANAIGQVNTANIISGNSSFGISLSGVGTENNLVIGNKIGTNEAGVGSRGNLDGINISAGAKNNIIGGLSASERNIISGNLRDGVSLTGSTTTGNQIRGNFIGLPVAGNSQVPNIRHGVSVRSGANGNTIGSNSSAAGLNRISQNGGFGIFVSDPGSAATIINNIIGLSSNNTAAGNASGGIEVIGGATAVIGGVNANEGNVISSNLGPGITILGSNTSGVSIQGNLIGTDPSGVLSRSNQNDGIHIENSKNITIGDGGVVHNVIAANNGDGIHMIKASNVTVKGTYVGIDASGLNKLGNANGIRIENSANVLVGGPGALDRNFVSGSTFDGFTLVNSGTDTFDANVRIENNFIGLGINGTKVIPNKDGVQFSLVAQPIVLANNVISGNVRFGVRLASSSNQVIVGNKIGVQADGVSAAPNGSHGIIVHTNSSNNRIGGQLDGEGNIIANNLGDGVLIGSDPSAGFTIDAGVGNSVIRNLIFGNSGLAIDLGANNGTTANDANDADVGPNNLQNAPVISLATTVGDSIFIRGLLNSLVGNYRIDFYAGTTPGQAQKFIGTLLDRLDVIGNLDMALVLDASVDAGNFVMAIATNLDTGDSSELSTAVQVV